jgi:hypothetical protein
MWVSETCLFRLCVCFDRLVRVRLRRERACQCVEDFGDCSVHWDASEGAVVRMAAWMYTCEPSEWEVGERGSC